MRSAGPDHGPPVQVARARTGRGELALRRRGRVLQLVVDGVFAMDTTDVTTEEALAELALRRLDEGPDGAPAAAGLEVLVGGLGLGYTGRRVLADPRVRRLVVVELHAPLVEWARRGLAPVAGQVLADRRVHVEVADVVDEVTRRPAASLDAVLLDVDNGPGFLIHQDNDRVYAAPFLAECLRVLRPGGVLAIWSAQPEPALVRDLDTLARPRGARCEQVLLDVERDGRRLRHAVQLVSASVTAGPPAGAPGRRSARTPVRSAPAADALRLRP